MIIRPAGLVISVIAGICLGLVLMNNNVPFTTANVLLVAASVILYLTGGALLIEGRR